MEVEVIVNSESLNKDSSLVVGQIFFRHQGRCFPGEKWSDFVVVILGWWLHGYLKIARCEQEEVEFKFMDGPFQILVSRADSELCHLTFISTERVQFEADVGFRELGQQLLKVADASLDACLANGWTTSDFLGLTAARSELEDWLSK